MSIAVLGIVVLQVYLIRHDFEIKATQFDGQVMQAMNRIVEQVEKRETMRMVVRNLITSEDSVGRDIALNDSSLMYLTDLAADPASEQTQLSQDLSQVRELIRNRVEAIRQRSRENRTNYPAEGRTQLNDSAIDIRIEKDIQQKQVIDLQVSDKTITDDTLWQGPSERMESKLRKYNSMMQKLTLQIADPSESVFDRIPQTELDSIIRSELKDLESGKVCNYGILQKEQIIFLRSTSDSALVLESPYKLLLFPNDVFKRTEQLVVQFPGKVNFILGKIMPLILFSILFTCIIGGIFAYTLHIILRQKKLAEIKNDFINNMTHEFKTPIATIAIATETLRDARVHSSQEKLEFYTGIIREENNRMLRQVETVLQMAQLEKGEVKLKWEVVDLCEVLEAAVASMRLTIQQREGRMALKVTADECLVKADADHLLNVFLNLLDNANKYSPDAPEIDITLEVQENKALVSIKDNGIGMPRDVQRHIFDTFYRAASGNIHNVKGFGLGLSYVKEMVNAHQGSIAVQSQPGAGSIFSVVLPLSYQS